MAVWLVRAVKQGEWEEEALTQGLAAVRWREPSAMNLPSVEGHLDT